MGIMNLTKIIPRMCPAVSHRVFVTAPTRPLQKLFGKTAKEKDQDEACKKTKEATESLKEGAEQIKETSEFVKNMANSTSKTVKSLTKDVADKVSETTDSIVQKVKEPMKGAISDAWTNTTKRIEDKVAEKIRDRVMGKEEQAKKGDKPN